MQAGEIRLESLVQMMSLVNTILLEPEAIPLDVKVAIDSEPMISYLLYQLDSDFADLFKVKADFSQHMDRDSHTLKLSARLITTLAHQEDLMPFERDAVTWIIDHRSRLAGDVEKLTTKVCNLSDLLREADYWARRDNAGIVQAKHVDQTNKAQICRANRLQERMQEAIQRELILIDTVGEAVGQVNDLSVFGLGNFFFGHPSRITAWVRPGKGVVVNIEREFDLGGPLHSKDVLIPAGFSQTRNAGEQSLSRLASLVFEQLFSGSDGDSASSAEFYALLSATTGVPIRQSLAVTGSFNQHGVVQAISGVNEKTEGFFDLCQARGLTGEQGVLIPAANMQHLMLRPDVVTAVEQGQFHIYPVEHVDRGIKILTGLPTSISQGAHPPDSPNQRVKLHLAELANNAWQYVGSPQEQHV